MNTDRQRLRTAVQKLITNPFIPFLFIGKTIEVAAFWALPDTPFAETLGMGVIAIVTLTLWIEGADEIQGVMDTVTEVELDE